MAGEASRQARMGLRGGERRARTPALHFHAHGRPRAAAAITFRHGGGPNWLSSCPVALRDEGDNLIKVMGGGGGPGMGMVEGGRRGHHHTPLQFGLSELGRRGLSDLLRVPISGRSMCGSVGRTGLMCVRAWRARSLACLLPPFLPCSAAHAHSAELALHPHPPGTLLSAAGGSVFPNFLPRQPMTSVTTRARSLTGGGSRWAATPLRALDLGARSLERPQAQGADV